MYSTSTSFLHTSQHLMILKQRCSDCNCTDVGVQRSLNICLQFYIVTCYPRQPRPFKLCMKNEGYEEASLLGVTEQRGAVIFGKQAEAQPSPLQPGITVRFHYNGSVIAKVLSPFLRSTCKNSFIFIYAEFCVQCKDQTMNISRYFNSLRISGAAAAKNVSWFKSSSISHVIIHNCPVLI